MESLKHEAILIGREINHDQFNDCTSLEIIINDMDSNLLGDLSKLALLLNHDNLKQVYFYCNNYHQLQIFNRNFMSSPWKRFFILLDDRLLTDRSYIKPLEGAKLYVPVVYQMWGLRNYDVMNSNYYFYHNTPPSYQNIDSFNQKYNNNSVYIDYITALGNQIINYPNISELEKIILVSNYFMANFQYVAGKVSNCREFEYVTETYDDKAHMGFDNVNTLFQNKFGICCTFALGYWVACNNPLININCGVVESTEHAFNYIEYEGKYYGNDATWLITRNPSQVPGALKASSFTDEYILIGKDKLATLEHHKRTMLLPFRFAEKSVDRRDVQEAKKHLKSLGVKFDYGSNVPMSSYCRRKIL